MSLVIRKAAQLLRVSGSGGADLGAITNGSLVVRGGRIVWVGRDADLPPIPSGAEIIDATGRVVLPGLVDSHTHLIFAGNRADEFEARLGGATYEEIAARGGGIRATVRAVRHSSRDDLKRLARSRLREMLRWGVTTVEIKSGYGLTLDDERKCLEVVAELNQEEGLPSLVPTFLGAHAVPDEYAGDRAGYVRLLCDEMLPEIARNRLAEFCDVFCEAGAFSVDESRHILRCAAELGLKRKIHADEFSPSGGAELAAEVGATSADHLLRVSEAGVEALARAGVVATLLPGTAFFLGLDYAPARRLIEGGVPVALATDCNPGTCPTENLPLIGAMACTQMQMRPAEVVAALTRHAAFALGRADEIGTLDPGKQADILIADVPDYRLLFYHFGVNHVWKVIRRGCVVHAA